MCVSFTPHIRDTNTGHKNVEKISFKHFQEFNKVIVSSGLNYEWMPVEQAANIQVDQYSYSVKYYKQLHTRSDY